MAAHPIRAVIFDVGETIMDDTTFWGSWADWLGVPRHTLDVIVGHVTAEGRDNADALAVVRPGFNLKTEQVAREAAGLGEKITESDLYPDVRTASPRCERRSGGSESPETKPRAQANCYVRSTFRWTQSRRQGNGESPNPSASSSRG